MKVKDIRDINKLIDKYEGKVKFVTDQGDCMDLSCIISRCVAMVKILNGSTVQEGKIIFEISKHFLKYKFYERRPHIVVCVSLLSSNGESM